MLNTMFWNAGNYGHPFYGYGMMYSGGMYWVMGLFVLAVVAALVMSIIAIVRTSKKRTTLNASEGVRIVEERYAKGEITKEEFEIMKKDLR